MATERRNDYYGGWGWWFGQRTGGSHLKLLPRVLLWNQYLAHRRITCTKIIPLSVENSDSFFFSHPLCALYWLLLHLIQHSRYNHPCTVTISKLCLNKHFISRYFAIRNRNSVHSNSNSNPRPLAGRGWMSLRGNDHDIIHSQCWCFEGHFSWSNIQKRRKRNVWNLDKLGKINYGYIKNSWMMMSFARGMNTQTRGQIVDIPWITIKW